MAMKDETLTQKIIGSAFKVHNTLGAGYLEKVYENALRIELTKQGLKVEQQKPIKVYYEDEVVGEYFADLWVENQVIVELKAVQSLNKEHEVQLVNYLTATGVDTACCLTSAHPYRLNENSETLNPDKINC
jgi:GxxExxY protein